MTTFKIKTLGCKVNQYESQVIRERLIEAGHQEAEGAQVADFCILNTCTVTVKADKECREILRRFIRENPEADVVAAGCYVEKDADIIRAIDPGIRVINNRDKENIVELLKDNKKIRSTQYSVKFLRSNGAGAILAYSTYGRQAAGRRDTNQGITYFKGHNKAFIKIQDGCNNFCSYCKVPYVRGRSRSRQSENILKEAERLIDKGYKELILTGVCLGDFGKDLNSGITLEGLIRGIISIDNDFRLRLSSIEFPDVTDSLIDEITSSGKICNHLHIPLQSGDDDILSKMNRGYTSMEFIKRVDFIRFKIPDIAITTDIIVGFPQEGVENFNNTLKTVEKIRPSRSHIFTYSPRKGTKAYEMSQTVSTQETKQRFKKLKAVTDNFSNEFRESVSKVSHRVLVESARDKKTGKLTGYTDTYIRVLVDCPDEYIGKMIDYRFEL